MVTRRTEVARAESHRLRKQKRFSMLEWVDNKEVLNSPHVPFAIQTSEKRKAANLGAGKYKNGVIRKAIVQER